MNLSGIGLPTTTSISFRGNQPTQEKYMVMYKDNAKDMQEFQQKLASALENEPAMQQHVSDKTPSNDRFASPILFIMATPQGIAWLKQLDPTITILGDRKFQAI